MSKLNLFIMRWCIPVSGICIIGMLMVSCKTTGLTREQQSAQLGKMSWIVGNWQDEEGETLMREEWKKESDTLYTGQSFLIIAGDTVFREEISIKPGKRHIYYNVSMEVNGKPKYTSFVLMKNTSGSFVVEDPQNTDLSKISYSRRGDDKIFITTEGTEEGKKVRESYVLTKVR